MEDNRTNKLYTISLKESLIKLMTSSNYVKANGISYLDIMDDLTDMLKIVIESYVYSPTSPKLYDVLDEAVDDFGLDISCFSYARCLKQAITEEKDIVLSLNEILKELRARYLSLFVDSYVLPGEEGNKLEPVITVTSRTSKLVCGIIYK